MSTIMNVLIIIIGILTLGVSVISFQCYNSQDKSKREKTKWNYSVAMIVISILLIIGPMIAIGMGSKSNNNA